MNLGLVKKKIFSFLYSVIIKVQCPLPQLGRTWGSPKAQAKYAADSYEQVRGTIVYNMSNDDSSMAFTILQTTTVTIISDDTTSTSTTRRVVHHDAVYNSNNRYTNTSVFSHTRVEIVGC